MKIETFNTNTIREKTAPKEQPAIRRAAAYIRLSRETAQATYRDTIGNQKELVESFIHKQDDLVLFETYVDDAVSGTTFSRPAFDRMLSDMRRGLIQAIVVKDMSRIGRDYLEAGSLVEHVFPLYDIRLISITDGFDTAKNTDWLRMALTNLANTIYARDISQKINAVKSEMYKKGTPVGKVPYGYRLEHGTSRPGCMVIDNEAAHTVKRIFNDFIEGKGTTAISRELNNEGIPSPLAYRYKCNGQKDKASRYKWTANSVQQILGNKTYTGRYIMGKTSQKVFQPIKRMSLPENDWHVFEHHHPSIISDSEFKAALDKKRKKSTSLRHSSNLLARRIYCGKCGAHMGIPNSSVKNPKYMCRTNLYYGSGCSMSSVSRDEVYAAVLMKIRKKADRLSEDIVSGLVEKVVVYDPTRIEVVIYSHDAEPIS